MMAMMAKRTTKGKANHFKTFNMAVWPTKGSSAWISTAPMSSPILRPVLPATWAFVASARPARTTRAIPSVSYPTCVSQLKKDGARFPRGPNGARLIVKAVVPAWGPWRLVSPLRRYDAMLPMMMMGTAWANDKPKMATSKVP